jgi:hypothetical protein
MTDYPLVLVEWEDATGGNRTGGWREIADMRPRLDPVRSVGWLIHRDRKSVTILPNISVTQGDADLTIPRRWIKRLVALKEGDPL